MSNAYDRKIVTTAQLAQALESLRQAGRTVVQCHGCFDLVHPGHVRYLRFARELGDVLVVSLTADNGVAKGPDRPYIPAELRAENLAALEFVDWVVIDPHPTAVEILAVIKPDIYVKGSEYATSSDPRFLQERSTVESYGGRVVFHSGDVVFSSTRLIETLESDEQLDELRLRTLCHRADIDRYRLHATLDAFRGLPVLVVGDVIRERYVLCDAAATASDAPVLALQRLGTREYWGGAAALAMQLHALGAKPFLVAAVGAECSTQQLADDLTAAGVSAQLLPVRKSIVERHYFVADDTRLYQLNDGASTPLDSAWEKCAVATVLGQLTESKLLVWAEHGLGTCTPGLVQRATAAGRQAKIPLAGHAPGPRGELTLLRAADLLTMSERQLRTCVNDLNSSLPAVAARLLNRTQGRAALVALPKRGWLTFDRGATYDAAAPDARLQSCFVPNFAPTQRDPLGSEEAVLAIGALAVAAQRSLAETAYLAALVEALAVRKPGRTVVTVAELRRAIDARPELRPASRFVADAQPLHTVDDVAPPLQAFHVAGPAAPGALTVGDSGVPAPHAAGALAASAP